MSGADRGAGDGGPGARGAVRLLGVAARRAAGCPAAPASIPADFKRLLPTVSLIDVARRAARLPPAPGRHRPLRRLRPRDHRQARWTTSTTPPPPTTGAPNSTRWSPSAARASGVHNLAWRGAAHLSILWLRLPLASNGARRRHDPGLRRRASACRRQRAQRHPRGLSRLRPRAASASRRMRSTIENRPFDRCGDSAPVRPSRSNAALASKARISPGVRPE